jgi:hypothetical protein
VRMGLKTDLLLSTGRKKRLSALVLPHAYRPMSDLTKRVRSLKANEFVWFQLS